MALYLVTGGAGFIGSHLAEELVRRGEAVRVVDNLSTGKRQNLAHLPAVELQSKGTWPTSTSPGARWPASTTSCTRRRFRRCRARCRDPITSQPIEHRRHAERPRRGARRRRQARRLCGLLVGLRRHADAAEARGRCRRVRCRRTRCRSWSASSTARCSPRLYGLETVTIRYFNVFGPRQDPSSPYSGVISLFISALVDGRQPTIYGDGEQTRDFTYVANVVDGVLRACHAPGVGGKTVNVATGGRISLNELFATLCRADRRRASTAIYADARPGDVKTLAGGHRAGPRPAGVRTVGGPQGRASTNARLVSHPHERNPRSAPQPGVASRFGWRAAGSRPVAPADDNRR